MASHHALVAGATGIVGRRIAERLRVRGWAVTGLCRRPIANTPCPLIPVDLTDAADCRRKLGALSTVTHIFYAARFDHPEGERESVETNASMLTNLIGAVAPAATHLQHVNLVHGTKHYGHMQGPLALPLTEESPRAKQPVFYFAHEDFIRAASRDQAWACSIARPHTFCDEDAAEPRNAALLIAVLAALARERNQPLDFPGSEHAYEARTQFTYVPLLARAVEWMATDPRCANQAYNLTNGDAPRWSELWPRLAAYFGVAPGRCVGKLPADFAVTNEAVWHTLVARCGLEPVGLAERVLWRYAEYLFAPEWDIISSTAKARRDGFDESVDSVEMFTGLFEAFRRDRIIP